MNSCYTKKDLTIEEFVGKYNWTGGYGVGSSMELTKNQTFIYKWQTGLISGTTLGIWKKEGHKIILNSHLQISDEDAGYEIVETKKLNSKVVTLNFVDTKGESVPVVNCFLKGDSAILEEFSTDSHGELKFSRIKEADSLIISSAGFKTIRYKLDPSISNYLFKMKYDNFQYEYFTEEVWVYKKGRLYDPSIKKSKYMKKNYYQRVN